MLKHLNFHISPENKLKLRQLLFICLYWIIMVRLIIIQDYFGLYGFVSEANTTKFISNLRESLALATSAGLAIGILTGIGELYVFPKKFYHKPFLVLNLYKLIVYFISLISVAFVTLIVYKIVTTDLGTLEILQVTWKILTSHGFLSLLSTGVMISLGINFILSMQNKIGFGSFIPMLLGKYHKPREEDRIFLFIDLKSSSFTAEKLGHVKYSQLIQACFRDLSDIAIKYNGEIYQFVGDEAVFTWKTKNKNNYLNAVQLFNKFKSELEKKSHLYYYEYGVMPKFKGAINSGTVMVAEVGGFLKSEIAYHGDVLNSASRMMEFCKPFESDLLVSDSVFSNLQNINHALHISAQGKIKLRGKNRQLDIYSIQNINSEEERLT